MSNTFIVLITRARQSQPPTEEMAQMRNKRIRYENLYEKKLYLFIVWRSLSLAPVGERVDALWRASHMYRSCCQQLNAWLNCVRVRFVLQSQVCRFTRAVINNLMEITELLRLNRDISLEKAFGGAHTHTSPLKCLASEMRVRCRLFQKNANEMEVHRSDEMCSDGWGDGLEARLPRLHWLTLLVDYKWTEAFSFIHLFIDKLKLLFHIRSQRCCHRMQLNSILARLHCILTKWSIKHKRLLDKNEQRNR